MPDICGLHEWWNLVVFNIWRHLCHLIILSARKLQDTWFKFKQPLKFECERWIEESQKLDSLILLCFSYLCSSFHKEGNKFHLCVPPASESSVNHTVMLLYLSEPGQFSCLVRLQMSWKYMHGSLIGEENISNRSPNLPLHFSCSL